MRAIDLLNGRLKLRHLVLVVAIADHGSVLRAAEHLHLAQPAVTRSLREVRGSSASTCSPEARAA